MKIFTPRQSNPVQHSWHIAATIALAFASLAIAQEGPGGGPPGGFGPRGGGQGPGGFGRGGNPESFGQGQDNFGPGQGGRGGREGQFGGPGGQGPGGFNPSAAQNQEIQTLVGASDEEWKVIGPKVQAVITARRIAEADLSTSSTFSGPGGGGPGGRGGPGGFGNDSFGGPSNVASGGMGGRGGRGGGGRGGRGPDNDGSGRGFGIFSGTGDGPASPGEIIAPSTNPQNSPPAISPGVLINRAGPGAEASAIVVPPIQTYDNPVAQALGNLQETLSSPTASPDDLKKKIAAVRSARNKARNDLITAQADLQRLLTLDQQAALISRGYLD